ncbi:hypothetical protein ACLMAJ_11320 [Nocardia sp. KC 131]|uniref:DUF7373 family lipoprotein n=1 Tax=Nocardia arseniciresistens TaxID=3392119 RepID=UPI00398E3944
MISRTIAFGCAVFAVALAATTGCGGSDTPHATVDVEKLDSGNYPTTPRTIERTDERVAVQEAIALAESVPLMMDVDNRLVFNAPKGDTFTPQHPPSPSGGFGTANFTESVPGLVAGFGTGARRRQDFSLGLNAELAILRFSNPAQASGALAFLADAYHQKNPAKAPVSIPGYPDARAEVSEYGSVNTWLAQGDYLIKTFISNPIATPPDPAPLAEFTKRLLDEQFQLLQNYRPPARDKLSDIPVDVDGLLGRTLPSKPDHARAPGIYTPHAGLHLDSRPDLTSRIFADAKVDLYALDDSAIYRTADAAATVRLIAAFVDQGKDSFAITDPPPGLPDAKCLKKLEDPVVNDLSSDYQCYIPFDRYVAHIGASQPQDLSQMAAAQYELLAYGR